MGDNDRAIGQLEGRVNALEGWVEGVEKRTRDDMADLKKEMKELGAKVDRLVGALNMGRGAGWAIIKFGAFMVVLAGAVAWAIEHMPKHMSVG